MSNITFLVSAVLTVFLLQGVEQTRLVPNVAKSEVSTPNMALKPVKNRALTLKTSNSIDKHQIDSLNIDASAVLTKS